MKANAERLRRGDELLQQRRVVRIDHVDEAPPGWPNSGLTPVKLIWSAIPISCAGRHVHAQAAGGVGQHQRLAAQLRHGLDRQAMPSALPHS